MSEFNMSRRSLPVLGIALCLFLRGPFLSAGALQDSASKDRDGRYLRMLESERQENWLKREVRKFRSYPHLERAFRLQKEGRTAEAREEFRKYLNVDPDDLQARFAYLSFLFDVKDYGAVVPQADLLLKKSPDFLPALIYRGLAEQALGQGEDAGRDFRAAAAVPGIAAEDRDFALNMLADIALGQKDFAQALSALDEMSPRRDGGFLVRRGLALEGLERWSEAEESFKIALESARTPSEKNQINRHLAENARKEKDWDGAARALGAVHALEPADVDIMRDLAFLAFDRKKSAESARWMRQVLALRSAPEDREFLVGVLENQRDYAGMVRELKILVGEAPSPAERARFSLALGNAYILLGKPALAAAAFKQASAAPGNLNALEALAEASEEAGRLEDAARAYQKIIDRNPRPQYHLRFGLVLDKLGRTEQAALHLAKAAAGSLPFAQKALAYKQLGFVYLRLEDFPSARSALEKSAQIDSRDSAVFESLAEAALRMNSPQQALAYEGKALGLARAGKETAAILEKLGLIALQLDRLDEASGYYEKAVTLGRTTWEVRQSLGHIHYRQKRWSKALENFFSALDRRRSPETLASIGLVYKESGKTGVAIHYLLQALAPENGLSPATRIAALNALGYLYAEEERYDLAARAWSESLGLRRDPVIGLRLGKMEGRLGRFDKAIAILESIEPGSLDVSLEAERWDELAKIHHLRGDPDKALEFYARANGLKAAADRHYRIGLILHEQKKYQDAASSLEKAVSLDPKNDQVQVALGYTDRALKKYEDSIRLFENVLARDEDYLPLVEDLGYLNMKARRNADASKWLRRAVDNEPLYPVESEAEREKMRLNIFRMRKENAKVTNRFDFVFYFSYWPDSRFQPVVPAGLGGGAVPAQGGADFAFQPARIGFRDERIFQVFARVMGNMFPRSLRPDRESYQGGIGLRYKPLRTLNFWLWGERLIRIGAQSRNDWLLRALLSEDFGYDLRPGRPAWDYTYFFFDAAYFTRTGSWAYYGEFRQGLTLNIKDSFLITPHLVIDARTQTPQPGGGSYLEAGIGLSLKSLLFQNRYETQRGSFEILGYYKYGDFLKKGFNLAKDPYHGLFIMAIFRF
jgi:adsorption protein A